MNDDFGAICIFAERYALGRQSYAPSLVAQYIVDNEKHLNTETLKLMIRDIEEAKYYGDEKIDKPVWQNLKFRLNQIVEERKDIA